MANLLSYYVRVKKERQAAHPRVKNPLWLRLLFPVIGLAALIWFLIRVIPKPSRATYPCQRIAFPLASGFVVWVMGLVGALAFLKRGRRLFADKKRLAAVFCILAGVLCVWISMTTTSNHPALAAEPPVVNAPIGIAKGIFPGRVVWVHDPNATDWDGPGSGDGYSWQNTNTSQQHVDAMIGKAIRQLTGSTTDKAAWDAMFRHFNNERGNGDIGYTPGEKITIKVNLTTCNYYWVTPVDPATYDKTSYMNASDTSPQVILAMLRQLVYKAGVDPNDIAVGDTTVRFANDWYDLLWPEFPQVVYFDGIGDFDRAVNTPSSIRQYWSDPDMQPADANDYIPSLYAEADYLINLPVLKCHNGGGITLCAKNHYGSYDRIPVEDGYYGLHDSLAGYNADPNSYRALVDIMGHPDMGGKTLLYLIDGLYGGYDWYGDPYRFEHAPFDNDWPSSILVSQDPVAIDSVGLDILWEQWDMVQIPASDDYLQEAALADNPPSGTFYDPDGDGIRLSSLGVHERWNNSTDRQYSRNLDPNSRTGIELVYVRMKTHPGDLSSDGVVETTDLIQLADQWLWVSPFAQPEPAAFELPHIREDLNADGIVNIEDFSILSNWWQTSD